MFNVEKRIGMPKVTNSTPLDVSFPVLFVRGVIGVEYGKLDDKKVDNVQNQIYQNKKILSECKELV